MIKRGTLNRAWRVGDGLAGRKRERNLARPDGKLIIRLVVYRRASSYLGRSFDERKR